MNNNIYNKFNLSKTQTAIIHSGRFHADDVMFAAMILTVAKLKHRNIEIKRLNVIPEEYSENIVVGDIGYGIYDHHIDVNGNLSKGNNFDTDDRRVSACGLLYDDVKNILFEGESKTKELFSALIDIIEHCDNSPDNNTFSDSINLLTPVNEENYDEAIKTAIRYCQAVLNGFINAHKKELSGKIWAVPRVDERIVPGIKEKRGERYWKAPSQIKDKYNYVSFNNKKNIKLNSMQTHSLAYSAIGNEKRNYWEKIFNKSDAKQQLEIEKRIKEYWPMALKRMVHKTIILDKSFPYGQYLKDTTALFVITPSQRGGYSVHFAKTNNDKFRFNPDKMLSNEGIKYIANDKRFIIFETKNQAISAAHEAGKIAEKYLSQGGIRAYRRVYGGLGDGYSEDFYKNLIGEDISLNLFVSDNIKNLKNITPTEKEKILTASADNPYLNYCVKKRLKSKGENLFWDNNFVISESIKKEDILSGAHKPLA